MRGVRPELTDAAMGAGESLITLALAVHALPSVVTGGVLAFVGRGVTLRPLPALVTNTHTLSIFALAVTQVRTLL